MLFLTQKKLDQRIADALQRAVEAQTAQFAAVQRAHDQTAEALRAEIAQLRADVAERETEIGADLVRRLTDERRLHEAGAQGLLASIDAVRRSIPALPDPQPVRQALRELDDTVQYILDGPVPVTTVINNHLMVNEAPGWARRMGAR
jgi:regulator of protease activity HflC (stomatin/prohibitin superfamily)